MDAYVAFVERSFHAQAPGYARRQKDIEERIERAFDMTIQEVTPPTPAAGAS
jgi:hypothetical protein